MFLDEVEIPLTSISKISDIDFAYELLRNEFLENFNSEEDIQCASLGRCVCMCVLNHSLVPY